MPSDASVRWGWLKAMYIYTFFGAGGFGLGMLFSRARFNPRFAFPPKTRSSSGFMGAFCWLPA